MMYKSPLVFLFTVVIFTACFAQQSLPKIYGTVKIDAGTAMKTTEVTLQEWMCFIANNGFDESLFPDSIAINTSAKIIFNDLRKGKDFTYLRAFNIDKKKDLGHIGIEPAKNFYKLADADTNYFSLDIPVTGITFNQAQRFCKWKEAMINEGRANKLTVSLPPIEVYKKVIPNIDSVSSKNCDCYRLNCSTAKFKPPVKDKKSFTQGKGLESIISYWPTDLGLYCIEGNAAEMTSMVGIAMGGSFRQTARESYNDNTQIYSKPEDWLGFRYIITAK